jgi:hypothetical protein
MAMELELVKVLGYDMYGRSALHAAIEASNLFPGSKRGHILYLIDQMLNVGADPRHMPTSIGGKSIPHHIAAQCLHLYFERITMISMIVLAP